VAHTYGGGGRLPATGTSVATAPVTVDLTLPAGTTVLWVSVVAEGTTARSGGAPTFNGVSLTAGNAKTNAGGTPETCAEDWYLLNPTTGSSVTLSIPNDGLLPLAIVYAYATAGTGKVSVYDNAVATAGVSTNPSTSFTVSDGAVWFAAIGDGAKTWAPTARSGTQIFDWDAGNWGRGAQYGLKSGTGTQTVSWTFGTSEDWIIEAISFKEAAASVTVSPSSGTVRLVGNQAAVYSFSGTPNPWFLRLTDGAPTWATVESTGITPGTGTLRLVGQAPTLDRSEGSIDGGGTIANFVEADLTTLYEVQGGVTSDLEVRYQITHRINPTAGILRLVPNQPTVGQAFFRTPSRGVLRLVGNIPLVERGGDVIVSPSTGVLRLVGQEPTVDVTFDVDVSPVAGALRLVGQQPFLGAVNPQVGTLRFVGQQPTISRYVFPLAGTLRFVGRGTVSSELTVTYTVFRAFVTSDFVARWQRASSVTSDLQMVYQTYGRVVGVRVRGAQEHLYADPPTLPTVRAEGRLKQIYAQRAA
jgi:hypothetical protein